MFGDSWHAEKRLKIQQVHEKASLLASQSQTTVFVGQWME